MGTKRALLLAAVAAAVVATAALLLASPTADGVDDAIAPLADEPGTFAPPPVALAAMPPRDSTAAARAEKPAASRAPSLLANEGMPRARSIRGIVVDANGPVEGARVAARGVLSGLVERLDLTTTDAQGRFAFEDSASNGMVARPPGAPTMEFDILADHGSRRSGPVRCRAGVLERVLLRDTGTHEGAIDSTPEAPRVGASAGLLPEREPPAEGTPDFSEPGAIVEAPPTARVRGRVTDREGRAIAGARVSGGFDPTFADDEGRFETAIATGRTRLRAAAPGFASATSAWFDVVDGGEVERDIHLDRGGTIFGQLRDESGSPIVGAIVRIYGGSPVPWLVESVRSHPDGAWEARNVKGTSFRVMAFAEGYAETTVDGVEPDSCVPTFVLRRR